MSLHKITFLAFLSLLTLGLQAQTMSLSDYRWSAIEATGDVKERHEDAIYLMGAMTGGYPEEDR